MILYNAIVLNIFYNITQPLQPILFLVTKGSAGPAGPHTEGTR